MFIQLSWGNEASDRLYAGWEPPPGQSHTRNSETPNSTNLMFLACRWKPEQPRTTHTVTGGATPTRAELGLTHQTLEV